MYHIFNESHILNQQKTEDAAWASSKEKCQIPRSTFTIPLDELHLIDKLREELGEERKFNKSELLRAGVIALTRLSPNELMAVAGQVTRLKRGPKVLEE